jgi:hypothetical protein
MRWARLIHKQVVEAPMLEAAKAMENVKERIVGKTQIGDVEVSTVFLAFNHGIDDRPLWFETMVFGGEHDQYQERYETYSQAEEGHKRVVEMVRTGHE